MIKFSVGIKMNYHVKRNENECIINAIVFYLTFLLKSYIICYTVFFCFVQLSLWCLLHLLSGLIVHIGIAQVVVLCYLSLVSKKITKLFAFIFYKKLILLGRAQRERI